MGISYTAYETARRLDKHERVSDGEGLFGICGEVVGEAGVEEVYFAASGRECSFDWSATNSTAWFNLLAAVLFGQTRGKSATDPAQYGQPFHLFLKQGEFGPEHCAAIHVDFATQRGAVGEKIVAALHGEIDNDAVRDAASVWIERAGEGQGYDSFMQRYDQMAMAFAVCGTGTGYFVNDL